MNNFTKSELKDLLDCVEVIIEANTISEMAYDELAEKIMYMIDNYTEIDQELAEIRQEIENQYDE